MLGFKEDLLVNLSLAITRAWTPEKDHDMTGLVVLLITSPTTNEDHKFDMTKNQKNYVHLANG